MNYDKIYVKMIFYSYCTLLSPFIPLGKSVPNPLSKPRPQPKIREVPFKFDVTFISYAQQDLLLWGAFAVRIRVSLCAFGSGI